MGPPDPACGEKLIPLVLQILLLPQKIDNTFSWGRAGKILSTHNQDKAFEGIQLPGHYYKQTKQAG